MIDRLPIALLLLLCVAPLTELRAAAVGIVADDQGGVVFLDQPRHRILRYHPDEALRVVAEFDPAIHGKGFRHLCRDAAGALYTAPRSGQRVWKIGADGAVTAYYPAADAADPMPVGLAGRPFAVAADGSLVTVHADIPSALVWLSPAGTLLHEFKAETGDGVFDLRDGAMTLEVDGTVWITADACRVVRIGRDGERALVAGGAVRGYRDGSRDEARFATPLGLLRLADPPGLLVADHSNRRVRRIAEDGAVTTIATFEWRNYPAGLARSSTGEVYALEHYEDVTRVYRLEKGEEASDTPPTCVTAHGGTPDWIYLLPALAMTIVVLVFMLGGAAYVYRKRWAPS